MVGSINQKKQHKSYPASPSTILQNFSSLANISAVAWKDIHNILFSNVITVLFKYKQCLLRLSLLLNLLFATVSDLLSSNAKKSLFSTATGVAVPLACASFSLRRSSKSLPPRTPRLSLLLRKSLAILKLLANMVSVFFDLYFGTY